ncbi:hypothetical protein FOZ63_030181 [Perkinsus olseni]|uniref:Uncharacterized protein n=1 Tax=Perkinsus olseni TaxID=32597 RepID=A0A7J6Q8V0_PEROL|nr:hypothetical protein FOZ63_030181 [Perkinsus olseni]
MSYLHHGSTPLGLYGRHIEQLIDLLRRAKDHINHLVGLESTMRSVQESFDREDETSVVVMDRMYTSAWCLWITSSCVVKGRLSSTDMNDGQQTWVQEEVSSARSPSHVRAGGGYVALDEMIKDKETKYLRTRSIMR